MPTGPGLLILPGKGVGPIRIGATVATIERLMSAPCDVKTPTLCSYPYRAVDFELDAEGVTKRIRVHRLRRPVGTAPDGTPQLTGVFNGRLGNVSLGYLPEFVEEELGPPKSRRAVTEPNPWNTVEVAEYEGFTAEYDRLDNGKVALGGLVIQKPATPAAPK